MVKTPNDSRDKSHGSGDTFSMIDDQLPMINSTKNPAEAFFKTVRVDYPLNSAALLFKEIHPN
jgi:hypothetical protein